MVPQVTLALAQSVTRTHQCYSAWNCCSASCSMLKLVLQLHSCSSPTSGTLSSSKMIASIVQAYACALEFDTASVLFVPISCFTNIQPIVPHCSFIVLYYNVISWGFGTSLSSSNFISHCIPTEFVAIMLALWLMSKILVLSSSFFIVLSCL